MTETAEGEEINEGLLEESDPNEAEVVQQFLVLEDLASFTSKSAENRNNSSVSMFNRFYELNRAKFKFNVEAVKKFEDMSEHFLEQNGKELLGLFGDYMMRGAKLEWGTNVGYLSGMKAVILLKYSNIKLFNGKWYTNLR